MGTVAPSGCCCGLGAAVAPSGCCCGTVWVLLWSGCCGLGAAVAPCGCCSRGVMVAEVQQATGNVEAQVWRITGSAEA